MKNRRRVESKHAFTDAECSRIRQYLSQEEHDFQALFEIGINSSFFYTDLSQLKRKDLQNILNLRHVNQHGLLEYKFNNRTIYLNETVKSAIQKFLNQTSYRQNDAVAFRTASGMQFRKDIISHYLEYWCDASRCERGSFRKTFFVNLYKRGVPIIALQQYLRFQSREKVLKYFNIKPISTQLPLPNTVIPTAQKTEHHAKCCENHTETIKKLRHEVDHFRDLLQKKESEIRFLKRNFKVLLEHFANFDS